MQNRRHDSFWLTLVFPVVLLVFPFSVYFPQSANPFHSDAERKAFASFLFNKGDYLRARFEWESLSSGSLNDTVRLRLAYSCIKANDFKSALAQLALINDTLAKRDVRNYLLRNWFENGDYEQLTTYVSHGQTESGFHSTEMPPLVSVARLLSGNTQNYSPSSFATVADNEREMLLAMQKKLTEPAGKSVWGAALLSTVVPGLGKIYTGKTGDGITAAIVTGLLGFLAVDNFNNGHNFRGYVFSVAGAVFYAGNIYGSAASAQIVNEEEMQSARERLSDYVKARNCFLEPASIPLGGRQ